MGKVLLLAVLSFFASMTTAPPYAAYRSCPGGFGGPPCAEVWRTDVVFVGTVTRVTTVPFTQAPVPDWQEFQKLTATLKVEELFRGEIEKEATFEMADCYYPFKEGEKYLVYAGKAKDGKLNLKRNYTRTRPISEAAEDLTYLRGLATVADGGRIYGTLFDHRVRPTLRAQDELLYSNFGMAGIRIFARSGDKSYQTVTDPTGFYEFAGVPEGEYALEADLPGSLSGTRELARVHNKGCAPTRFSIQAKGAIAGRLIDSARAPIKNAIVTIFFAEGVTEQMFALVKPNYTVRSQTDERGQFTFVRLPAGRYILAVNLLNEERVAGSRATDFTRLFYPGVKDFEQTKAITLGDGKEIKDLEFQLPSQ